MSRHYTNTEGTRFSAYPDESSWPVPDGMTEVPKDEYDEKRAAARQATDQASAAFLAEARAPHVEAARKLVELGLTVEQAAAMSRVPVADLTETTR